MESSSKACHWVPHPYHLLVEKLEKLDIWDFARAVRAKQSWFPNVLNLPLADSTSPSLLRSPSFLQEAQLINLPIV